MRHSHNHRLILLATALLAMACGGDAEDRRNENKLPAPQATTSQIDATGPVAKSETVPAGIPGDRSASIEERHRATVEQLADAALILPDELPHGTAERVIASVFHFFESTDANEAKSALALGPVLLPGSLSPEALHRSQRNNPAMRWKLLVTDKVSAAPANPERLTAQEPLLNKLRAEAGNEPSTVIALEMTVRTESDSPATIRCHLFVSGRRPQVLLPMFDFIDTPVRIPSDESTELRRETPHP